MDWKRDRIKFGVVALVVVVGAAIWAVQRGTGDTPAELVEEKIEGFPKGIERSAIQSLEIKRPNEEAIRLEKRGEEWWLSAPVEAKADRLSVDTALDKLAGLELESVASRKREKHALLEVDEAHGIHVVARGADKVLADLWIGATRSGNTAVRVNGQDATGMVKGSIRYAFSRDLRDWRDRTILAIEPEEVKEVEWKGPNGYFRFIRPLVEPSLPPDADAGGTPEKTLGDWTIAQVSYVPQPEEGKDAGPPKPPVPRNTIEHFQPSKVRTAVSIIARLRAADFAPSNLTPEEAGINADSPRVTLTTRDGQVAVLRLGKSTKEGDDQFYLMREGEQTIYIISKYHSQRIHPTVSEFEAPPSGSSSNTSKENSEKGEFSTVPRKVEPDEVPPEIMRQLEAQLRERH